MFFGFTARFQELVRSLNSDANTLIIRMDRVPHIDQSGLYAMENALLELKRKQVRVLLTGVHTQPLDMPRRIDIVPALIPEVHLFETFEGAINWVKTHSSEDPASLVQKKPQSILATAGAWK